MDQVRHVRFVIAVGLLLSAIALSSSDVACAQDVEPGGTRSPRPQREPTSRTYYHFIRAGDQFVAMGSDGLLLSSPDAVTWSVQRIANPLSLSSLTWGNGRYVGHYVVKGDGQWRGDIVIVVSRDGKAWTEQRSSAFAGAGILHLKWVNNQFIAIGYDGFVATSPDGIEWTKRNSTTTTHLNSVFGGNGWFVISGFRGLILISSDGVTWESVRSEGKALPNDPHLAVAWSGRYFVAVSGSSHGTSVRRSADGRNWDDGTFFPQGQLLTQVVWNNGLLVAAGTDIAVSPDGSRWTLLNVGATPLGQLAGGAGTFAIFRAGHVLTSTDGMTWRGGTLIESGPNKLTRPDTLLETSPVGDTRKQAEGWMPLVPVAGLVFFTMSGASLVAYTLLQVVAFRRTRGVWRGLTLLPAIAVGLVLITTARGFALGSNLWPVAMIFVMAIVVIYLLLLLITHAVYIKLRRKSSS